MPEMVEFDLALFNKELNTVIERIHVFSEQLQKKGARAAARKAMVPVREAARANAKRINNENTDNPSKGNYSIIWKNIVINESQRGGKREGGVVMRVGVRGGALYRIDRTLAGGKGFRYKKGTAGVQVKTFGKTKKPIIHPGGDTRHWRHVELGTQYMAARPFMRPALENNIARVIDELSRELNVQIDKMAQFVGPPRPPV